MEETDFNNKRKPQQKNEKKKIKRNEETNIELREMKVHHYLHQFS